MSRMLVARVGTGPLHVTWPPQAGMYEAVCGAVLKGNVVPFTAGRPAVAVWAVWRHCPKCEEREQTQRARQAAERRARRR